MKKSLFNEFPKTSTQDWKKIIEKDLKGSDYNKLIWRTNEDLDFEPFYRLEDIKNIKYISESIPGVFPYYRGDKTNNNWKITQEIFVSDIIDANRKSKEFIDGGAESLIFNADIINSYDDLALLLSDINPEKIDINFKITNESSGLFEFFLEYITQNNYDRSKVSGSLFYDPNKSLLLNGNYDQDTIIKYIKSNLKLINQHPINYNILTIHSYPFKSSGANIVQELSYTFSSAIDYLINLSKHEISIDDLSKNILFSFSISSNYFMEIAKLRAARIIWSNIIEQFDPESELSYKIKIHCHSADFNKTIFDPHVNLLRCTVEAMAAAIGGADSILITPFDKYLRTPDEFSDRIARNIQLITKHESFLDKVVDPSAGSYYVEKLTNSIANESLKLIIEIEELGGFISAVKNEFLQNEILKSKTKLEEKIEKRRLTILGTNQFPSLKEETQFSHNKNNTLESNKESKTLNLFRASEKFENLRLTTYKKASEKGENIKVFLLPVGDLAMRTARANFSLNFFGCAGFEIIDNSGFEEIDEGIKATIDSNAAIVVICSSDKEYPDLVPEIIKKIRKSDKKIKIIVAGYPQGSIEKLTESGVDDFIHIRSNALQILTKYQERLM